ncbi:MAG: Heavy metal binding domain [Bacteroidota bacterium]|jgi:Cu2+-exporting ATPase
MTKTIIILAMAAISLMACNNTEENKNLKVATSNNSIQYQCPMKDQHDTSYTTAGECPKCGMELEKIK